MGEGKGEERGRVLVKDEGEEKLDVHTLSLHLYDGVEGESGGKKGVGR